MINFSEKSAFPTEFYILKLNGTIGTLLDQTELELNKLSSYDPLDLMRAFNEFSGLLSEQLKLNAESENRPLKTGFSWDIKNPRYQLLNLKQSNSLIIIGYSFPTFNRIVDKELVRAFLDQPSDRTLYKKIYIQTPNEISFKSIKTKINA